MHANTHTHTHTRKQARTQIAVVKQERANANDDNDELKQALKVVANSVAVVSNAPKMAAATATIDAEEEEDIL